MALERTTPERLSRTKSTISATRRLLEQSRHLLQKSHELLISGPSENLNLSRTRARMLNVVPRTKLQQGR